MKKNRKRYELNQSIFYLLRSKKKLAKILNVSLEELKRLSLDSNYRVFNVEGGVCNLTGKILKPRAIQNPNRDLKSVQKNTNKFIKNNCPRL